MKKLSPTSLVYSLIISILAILLSEPHSAHANIVINGTRIIYPADEREVSVKLNNEGEHPSLTQIWFDSGDIKSSPKTSKAPFIATPPISRIDAGKAQTIRLMYTQEPLPEDQESVFWLNVLDIPPLPKAGRDEEAGNNFMQLALRIRIKIFFRPKNLTGTAERAAEQIHWQLTEDQQTHNYVLHADNPSAYHVSLISAQLSADGKTIDATTDMLNPKSSSDFALPSLTNTNQASPASPALSGPIELTYVSINDFGVPVKHTTTIKQSSFEQIKNK
jgi:chaperone protein EcpD